MERPSIFAFRTIGCRLNQAEEEALRRQVLEAGFLISEPEHADFCLVNSCSVTVVADRKTHQEVKRLKIVNCKLKIIIIGCGAEVAKDYPEVDMTILNKDKPKAIKIILEKFKIKIPAIKYQITKKYQNSNNQKPKPKTIQTSKTTTKTNSKRTRALLKIQDGCNNFCAYCIVPYLRGREVSVPVEEVISEAKKLEAMGYKELVLTGVNVGKYQCSSKRTDLFKVEKGPSFLGLTGLIEIIIKETSFPRIRLSSINPQDVTSEMIRLWAGESRLCQHFHLSLQSGSDSVLKRMGRPYNAQQYYSLSKKVVQQMPDAAITTDIIVGFPDETDQEFAETCDFVRKIGFAKLHVFRFSPRSGTRAAKLENQIQDSVKTERSDELIKIGKELEIQFKNQFIGRKMAVLFEEKKPQIAQEGLSFGKDSPSETSENTREYWYGLTSNYIRIKRSSASLSKGAWKNLENQIVKIKIKKENLA